MKSIIKISLPGWFYFDQCCLKFLFQIKFCVLHMIFICFMNVLNKPLLNGYSSREGPTANVYPGLLKQNWIFSLSEGTGLSMKKIHHHALQFVDGTRNLCRQGQCWMQWEVIYPQKILHPQKFVAACYLQPLFVLACHLAEVSLIFALCKHTIVIFCVEPCALLKVVILILCQQRGWIW